MRGSGSTLPIRAPAGVLAWLRTMACEYDWTIWFAYSRRTLAVLASAPSRSTCTCAVSRPESFDPNPEGMTSPIDASPAGELRPNPRGNDHPDRPPPVFDGAVEAAGRIARPPLDEVWRVRELLDQGAAPGRPVHIAHREVAILDVGRGRVSQEEHLQDRRDRRDAQHPLILPDLVKFLPDDLEDHPEARPHPRAAHETLLCILVTASPIITAANAPMHANCSQSDPKPAPFSMMPRTATRKNLFTARLESTWRTTGMLETGNTNPERRNEGSSELKTESMNATCCESVIVEIRSPWPSAPRTIVKIAAKRRSRSPFTWTPNST